MKKRLIYWIVLLVFVAVDCFALGVAVADGQTLTVRDNVQSFGNGFKACKNNVSVVNPDWQFTTPSDALTLWLRVIGDTDWLRIELSEFLL